MNTYIFPLWMKGKQSVCIDAIVYASSEQEAAAALWRDGVCKVWIMGDCRYAASGVIV